MKKKKFAKKMVLNKTTVTNLGDSQLTAVKGGSSWAPRCFPKSIGETYCGEYTCNFCVSDFCESNECPATNDGPTCND